MPDPLIFNQAQLDGVSFVVLDSPENLGSNISFLEFALTTSLGYAKEVQAHSDLLKQIRTFSASTRLTKVDCSSRWCLYRIKSR